MKKITLLATAMAALGLLTGPVGATPRDTSKGEERLARILKDRVPGKPVDCIPAYQSSHAQIVDRTAIVYDLGSVIYVNRPTNAQDLSSSDIMVTNIYGSQLCSVDTVRLHDQTSHFYTGFVGLNKFVPYRKVASAQ